MSESGIKTFVIGTWSQYQDHHIFYATVAVAIIVQSTHHQLINCY